MSESQVHWFLRWGDATKPLFAEAADAADACTLYSEPGSGCAATAAQKCLDIYRTEMCKAYKRAHEFGSIQTTLVPELRRAYARNVKRLKKIFQKKMQPICTEFDDNTAKMQQKI